MRILITTFTFAPQANGVAEVAGAHAAGLAARGHEVVVATGRDPQRTKPSNSVNPTVEEFDVRLDTPPATGIGPDILRYQDFIRNFRGDVILCHCWQVWSTDLAMPALRQNPAKKVLASHGFDAHQWARVRRIPWGLWRWLKSQPYVVRSFWRSSVFDHLVFLSARTNLDRFFDKFILSSLARRPFSVIPNGTYPERFASPRLDFRERHNLKGNFVLLYVAVFGASKNQALAVRAFLKADIPNSTLVLIGNHYNQYSKELTALSETLSKCFRGGKILILEKLSREEIIAAYTATDIAVMSSRRETQPLALLDAMAAGKPFISTDVGCVSEFPGGLIARDETEFMTHIRSLHSSPALRQSLGAAGKAACENTYNWQRAVSEYEALFGRLMTRQDLAKG